MSGQISASRAMGLVIAAAVVWAAAACGSTSPRGTAIELLAVVEIDHPTTAITDGDAHTRLLAAVPPGPDRDRIAGADLTDQVLVAVRHDACTWTNPRLEWRGDDHLTTVFDDTGVNCFVEIPAIAVFALERDGLPDRVTLGDDEPRDTDLVIHARR